MKQLYIILWVAWINLLPMNSFAQTPLYQTVKVRGTVTMSKNNKPLKQEQKFKTTDALTFKSKKDGVVVTDHKKGTFLLTPEASLKKYRVHPLTVNIDTRPGKILSDWQLRQFLLQQDSLLLLSGRFSLELGKEAFPMDTNHFFYLQYVWKGETIHKRLGFHGDTLIIDKNELFKVDGLAIDPLDVPNTFFLRYYNTQTQESVAYPDLEHSLHMVIPQETELRTEVRILLKNLDLDPSTGLSAIDNYLSQLYGKPGLELYQWLTAP